MICFALSFDIFALALMLKVVEFEFLLENVM